MNVVYAFEVNLFDYEHRTYSLKSGLLFAESLPEAASQLAEAYGAELSSINYLAETDFCFIELPRESMRTFMTDSHDYGIPSNPWGEPL